MGTEERKEKEREKWRHGVRKGEEGRESIKRWKLGYERSISA